MLCALGYLDADTLEESTTLLLLLLYDVGFKYDCTAQLIEYYGWLLQRVVDSGDPKHPVTVALDRMTVQLFNTEEVSIRCEVLGSVGHVYYTVLRIFNVWVAGKCVCVCVNVVWGV